MTDGSVLVCVTGQKTCGRLIREGEALAKEHHLPLLVLSVSGSGKNLLEDPQVNAALNYLYGVSAEAGAEMTMLHSSDAHKAICDFARQRGVRYLVVGEGRGDPHGFIGRLMDELETVAFHIVPGT